MGVEFDKFVKGQLRKTPKSDPHRSFLLHVLAENKEHERAIQAASREAMKAMGQLDPKAEIIVRSRAIGDLINERIFGNFDDSSKLSDMFPKSDDSPRFNSDLAQFNPLWRKVWPELRPEQKVQVATSFGHLMEYVKSHGPTSDLPRPLYGVIAYQTLGELRALDEHTLSLIPGLGTGNAALVHAAVRKREPQAPHA